MGAQELDKDPFEVPTVNPWRQRPTREQMRFALDLCRTELDDPRATISRLPGLSRLEISTLISSLKMERARRLRKAPRRARWRLAPFTKRP